MHEVKLSPATFSDIQEISALAAKIWRQYYPSIIGLDQIEYMLKMMYSVESLTNQLNNEGHQFYFVQNEGSSVGFISVKPEAENKWFINKFYINQELSGQGLGCLAFEELKKILAPKNLKLTVNRHNYKAINFYFKCGFKIKEVADFDIGNNFVMNDFVMEWK